MSKKKLVTKHAGQTITFQLEGVGNVRIEKTTNTGGTKVFYLPKEALLEFAGNIIGGERLLKIMGAGYMDMLTGKV